MVLPNVGVFTIKNGTADLDFVKGILRAPQSHIQFKPGLVSADKNFFQFLSKEMKVDEWKAVKAFQEFVHQLRESIDAGENIQLEGIGQLKKGYNDDLLFIENTQNAIISPLDIRLTNANDSKANLVELYKTGDTLIVVEETEDDKLEMIVKEDEEDYWWVYAVILALMGIGALLYYYI
ncbi:MAG: hypothetical protein ACOVNY_01510 [Chitinophagaceae bacterium]